MNPDDLKPDDLAKRGFCNLGVARLGVMRLGVTRDKRFPHLLASEDKLKALEARQQARAPKHQKGQELTTKKLRDQRDDFVRRVDAERAKSDETTVNDAIQRVLKRRKKSKKNKKTWLQLTPPERKQRIRNARKAYDRAKAATLAESPQAEDGP